VKAPRASRGFPVTTLCDWLSDAEAVGVRIPPAPDDAELAKLGVARISYGGLLHHDAMDQFGRRVASLA
jgi:hypothetical protein